MRYLIIYRCPETGEKKVFFSNWFSAENNFNPELDMIVIDNLDMTYMVDGKTWQCIEEDHL